MRDAFKAGAGNEDIDARQRALVVRCSLSGVDSLDRSSRLQGISHKFKYVYFRTLIRQRQHDGHEVIHEYRTHGAVPGEEIGGIEADDAVRRMSDCCHELGVKFERPSDHPAQVHKCACCNSVVNKQTGTTPIQPKPSL